MAVAQGRKGKITVDESTGTKIYTVAEFGTWNISGINRNMIEHTAFGDDVMRFKPGFIDPGSISFSGFFDGTDSTGQGFLIGLLSSGYSISNSSARDLRKLRLWANDDTTLSNYGFWSCTGSSGEIFVQSMETAQDKNGLGTVSFTLKISEGLMAWSTST